MTPEAFRKRTLARAAIIVALILGLASTPVSEPETESTWRNPLVDCNANAEEGD
jgi:hypothetical protein